MEVWVWSLAESLIPVCHFCVRHFYSFIPLRRFPVFFYVGAIIMYIYLYVTVVLIAKELICQ